MLSFWCMRLSRSLSRFETQDMKIQSCHYTFKIDMNEIEKVNADRTDIFLESMISEREKENQKRKISVPWFMPHKRKKDERRRRHEPQRSPFWSKLKFRGIKPQIHMVSSLLDNGSGSWIHLWDQQINPVIHLTCCMKFKKSKNMIAVKVKKDWIRMNFLED